MDEHAHDAEPSHVARRDFIKTSAFAAAAAAGTAILPTDANAAQAKPVESGPTRRKTFLFVEGHIDDGEIGAGGVLIQAACLMSLRSVDLNSLWTGRSHLRRLGFKPLHLY